MTEAQKFEQALKKFADREVLPFDVKRIYKDAGALLEGHFLLSSGKHSAHYLQSAKVLEDPKTAERLATALADDIRRHLFDPLHLEIVGETPSDDIGVDTICSPALGGILAGYELARALGVRSIFTERVAGEMTLRRGFTIKKGERVIVCEDIITTGGSAIECAAVIEKLGGEVVAFAALADRGFCGSYIDNSECKLPNDKPFLALAYFGFDIYEANECPLCKTHGAPIKPGSRGN
ncbi:orotate phosphoribosyltransferase [Betaproteobacteria bacterium]|nr:orotate phosphoribosyltransferase [Betaproteobacteria bacterium]GHU05589.1 orotate phosphoribosyltransferase [Betaproteobacteria bacterium]GHU23735.1 orotate phosphoribosyltransferase [Betaproteobacteria bacterium]